ncbi:MAG: helix-turn-helix domain-containing protein [Deltaproteobacteria bacterium]|nr:helix-turn-helix domain-containing protein [Deltaproteobacteria bacterium]
MASSVLHLPSEDDAGAARVALRSVALLSGHVGPVSLHLRTADGASADLELPAEVLGLMREILAHMANGSAVTILPVEAELTTQQAAELLGVSRPYFVRLLEDGKIPFTRVGTHRRVLAANVLGYREARRARSKALLEELAAEAQELDLGY